MLHSNLAAHYLPVYLLLLCCCCGCTYVCCSCQQLPPHNKLSVTSCNVAAVLRCAVVCWPLCRGAQGIIFGEHSRHRSSNSSCNSAAQPAAAAAKISAAACDSRGVKKTSGCQATAQCLVNAHAHLHTTQPCVTLLGACVPTSSRGANPAV